MPEYPDNSHSARENTSPPSKRVEKVVNGTAKTRKQSEVKKFAGVFMPDEIGDVNPPFGSRGSSPFLYRTVDRTALAEEKPTGHSLVHFGPGLALEHPAALERL